MSTAQRLQYWKDYYHRRRTENPGAWKHFQAERMRRYRAANPEKTRLANREQQRRRRAAKPTHTRQVKRAWDLRKKYGFTPEGYAELFTHQQGLCAICGHRQKRTLHVDHNHKTGKVRGLLCDRCNLGLGYFGDNRQYLFRAYAYLLRAFDGQASDS